MRSLNKIKEIINKLLYILTKQQKVYGLIVVILSFIAALFELLGVSAIVPLVQAMIEPQKLREQKTINWMLGIFDINKESSSIVFVITLVVAIYILKNLYFSFYAWVKLKYSCKIQRECSILMFSSYLNRGYPFFLDHNVNEMLQGAVGDISGLYAMIASMLQLITQVSIVFLILLFMLYSDWQLAIGVAVAALFCLTIILLFMKKRMRKAGAGIRKYAIYVNKVLLEAFNGIKEVLVMNRQDYYIYEYKRKIEKKQKYQIIQGMGAETPAYFIETVCVCGIMGILCIKILAIGDKEGLVATLAAFAIGAFRILPGLGRISSDVNAILSYIPNLNAIYENIRTTSKALEVSKSIQRHSDDQEKINNNFETISIKNLRFSYSNDPAKTILDDINIDIHRGESIALIGETGAGKSTLADIILGLLQPNDGQVELDGHDIRAISCRWSKMIGFVPQSIYLSDNSIRANVAFGENENDIDEDKINDALERANILSFVETLPKGLDTEIGERGVRLSGGQCQRIGIARALYRNPSILILDEATSALDNDTERVIMDTIDKLQGTMTMIIIAHRLTTIKNCDKIYEIKDGKAVLRNYSNL